MAAKGPGGVARAREVSPALGFLRLLTKRRRKKISSASTTHVFAKRKVRTRGESSEKSVFSNKLQSGVCVTGSAHGGAYCVVGADPGRRKKNAGGGGGEGGGGVGCPRPPACVLHPCLEEVVGAFTPPKAPAPRPAQLLLLPRHHHNASCSPAWPPPAPPPLPCPPSCCCPSSPLQRRPPCCRRSSKAPL